jgi:hypothetical protein
LANINKNEKMGKKDNKKRSREEIEELNNEDGNLLKNDPELEAELAAVEAIRQEKQRKVAFSSDVTTSATQIHSDYNRNGLLKCINDWETVNLPFQQTMEISEFEFPSTNELDDMEREVSFIDHFSFFF